MQPAIVAALFALGAGCVAYASFLRARRLGARKRIAELAAENSEIKTVVKTPIGSQIRLRAETALDLVRARPAKSRAAAIGMAIGGAIIGLASGSPGWLGLVVFGVALARIAGQQARIHARVSKQMVGAVQLLAAGLRAGYSVQQAIILAARDSPEPTAAEFVRTAREIELGGGTQEALSHLSERTANADYALLSFIVGVQQQVGGNLARTLDAVSETLRERVELRDQVEALSAQQQTSAMVLTCLPGGIMLLLFLVDPTFVGPMFSSGLGRMLMGIAGALIGMGWVVMRAMGRVEI